VGTLEGHIADYFSVTVFKDGKTGTADWRSYNWRGGSEGVLPINVNLIEANPVKQVFTKVDGK